MVKDPESATVVNNTSFVFRVKVLWGGDGSSSTWASSVNYLKLFCKVLQVYFHLILINKVFVSGEWLLVYPEHSPLLSFHNGTKHTCQVFALAPTKINYLN